MKFVKPLIVLASALIGCSSAPPSSDGSSEAGRPGPTENPAEANARDWPVAASPSAISDKATEKAISRLLAKMSLEEKVGQLIQADISAISPEDLTKYPLGSILAGGNSGPFGNERANAGEWLRLVGQFRDASRKSGAGIPVLFGVDAVHGHSNLPGATIFPHNIGLGAAGDADLVRRIGAATAAEIAGSGIEWTFAPTLAVPEDLRWGRSYEGYSSDPALVADYAGAMTIGLQGSLSEGKPLGERQVAATAKHFIADGGTVDGRDQGDARISEAALVARHAAGYPAAIDAGALTVMASFSSWNGVKHHGNRTLLTDVLKKQMGFDGLVVGDWNGHGQVAGCSVTRCPAAINAGVDLFMAPDSWRGLFEQTVKDVQENRIPLKRVDDAVRRILRVKFKLGLMGPQLVERGDPAIVGSADHLALAREAVAKSLVLLKNNDQVLPIRPGARVLIAGPGADDMAMQAGGWTITWQGTDTTAADFPNGQTIGPAIAAAVEKAGGVAQLSPNGAYARRPDVAIVVTGERPYAEFQGDVSHLAFRPRDGETALIRRLRAQGVRVVVVFLSGRPLFTGDLMNSSDAFVAAWLPGTQGAGVADVLIAGAEGEAVRDFTGRLPFAWPDDARSPVANPLFPLGYGLYYGRKDQLARVNEDPRLDIASLDDTSTFFRRGMAPAPWHFSADGVVLAKAVDISAQEDARQFIWTGPGRIAIEGPPIDLSARSKAGDFLMLDWRIDARGAGPIKIELGGSAIEISSLAGSAQLGAVVETHIPLRCFEAAGADLSSVGAPLRLIANAGFGASLRTARITDGHVESACPAATTSE
jgi:beta-glucosidase